MPTPYCLRRRAALFVIVSSLFLLPCSLFPQGSLTPPGAPAPTMKTLTQVEPRIAVQTLTGDATSQFLITQPGSYYLTDNINGVSGMAAIAINADHVTLDLGGHSLIGVAGATRGVEIRGTRKQVAVRNGSIDAFETGGINTTGTTTNARIENMSVTGIVNGTGIAITGEGTRVRDCDLTSIGGTGISVSNVSGLVEGCVVSGCLDPQTVVGINARSVVSCTVNSIASSGLSATGIAASTAANCSVTTVGGAVGSTGITASAVMGCRVASIGSGAADGGSVTGISARSVSTSSVSTIGVTATTGSAIGISSKVVTGCEVESIGLSSSASGATGIFGETISNCRVALVRGGTGGSVFGITAIAVSHSHVESLSQGSSTGNLTGIQGDVIIGCSITSLAGSTSAAVAGIGTSTNVRDCSVSFISNAGSGLAYGLFRTSARSGNITDSVFRNCGDYGIWVASYQRITGCNISFAVDNGIRADGTGNVIDGNTLENCRVGVQISAPVGVGDALIVRNFFRNNSSVGIALGGSPSQYGTVVFAGGQIAAGTSPWANFQD